MKERDERGGRDRTIEEQKEALKEMQRKASVVLIQTKIEIKRSFNNKLSSCGSCLLIKMDKW